MTWEIPGYCEVENKMNTTKAFILSVFAAVLMPAASTWAGPVPPVNHERDLPAKVLARRAVIYSRPYTGAIYADYVPDDREARAQFSMAMASNEYEPMQVGFYVPTGQEVLKDVALEVKCLVPCRVGHIYYIPVEQLDWMADTTESLLNSSFPNITWPVDAKRLVNKRSAMPMYILPVARIAEIRPGRSAAFWVTFHPDERIPAGAHKGTFRIRAQGKAMQTVPFTVKVYPFALPRPKLHYGLYHQPMATPVAFQGREFLKLYLADMAAHGMNFMDLNCELNASTSGSYGQGSSPLAPPEHHEFASTRTRLFLDNFLLREDYLPDGGYNVLTLVDNQIRMGREAGLIQRDHPCVTHPSDIAIDNKSDVLATLRGYPPSSDWPHIHYYMRDEPPPSAFAMVNQHVSQWRRLGVTTIAALNGSAPFAVGSVHSVWTVLTGQITTELLGEAHRVGAEVWTYDFHLRATNVESGRFNTGLYTWSLGLNGNMSYRYFSGGYGAKNKMHFDAGWDLHGPADCGYVVASRSGPVPGVGFEGMREGIDDVRYLQLLEARVKAAPSQDPTTQEAGLWLDNLRSRSYSAALAFCPGRYGTWGTDFMDPHPGLAPNDYDVIRAAAAAYIQKLPATPGELNPEPSVWLRMQPEPMEAEAYAEASIAVCLKTLKTGTIKQKRQAAATLATRKPDEILPARQLLTGLLAEPQVRVVALQALAKMGPEAATAMFAISKLLASEDVFMRWCATYTLSRIGPAAREALAPVAEDPDFYLPLFAKERLEKLNEQ
jgi:hypothetical protein